MIDNDGGSTKGHDPNGESYSSNGSKKQSRTPGGVRRRGRRRPLFDQRFSAYMSFGFHATVCLAIFLSCYVLILLCLSPLLVQEAPVVTPTHRGEVLRPVVRKAVEKVKHSAAQLGHANAGRLAENVAVAIQHKIQQYRKSEGVTDTSLLRQAVNDIENVRKHRRQKQQDQQEQQKVPVPDQPPQVPKDRNNKNNNQVQQEQPQPKKPVSGFVVLGMHRSGTSMLSGLLVTGMGYKTGGPLIGSAFDNEKGFFELVAAVLQNDEFMVKQRIWWSSGVIDYDYQKALTDLRQGRVTFKEGQRALAVLNNPDLIPFLQKDPRMCITLKTWLPLLNSEPAVLFTYRHPLEVAQSLQRRENGFTLDHGLRLWIVYNMRAVQNSANLCRVTTSNQAILANPLQEVNRTSYELTTKCRVPPPPNPQLSKQDVDKFVDSGLQHAGAQKKAELAKRRILATHNDGVCKVYEYDSDYKESEQPNNFAVEMDLYLKAMKMYCDFESGAAYQPDYEWPKLK